MLKDRALVRLLKPCSFRRGRGLTTSSGSRFGRAKTRIMGHLPLDSRESLPAGPQPPNLPPPPNLFRLDPEAAVALPHHPYQSPSHPLMPSPATIERFLAHCHRRRYPPRTDVFR